MRSCFLAALVVLAVLMLALDPAMVLADVSFPVRADYITGGTPNSVAIGDLNGDGIPDLAVATAGSKTVTVFLGNGNGSFRPRRDFGTASTARFVAIGDLNGDGIPDLAVANPGSAAVSVLYGIGDGTFGSWNDFATGGGSICVAIGDLNGDGKPDLATANGGNNTVSVLLGNGDGTFGTHVEVPTGVYAYSVAIGDLNGDGKLDLAVANDGSSTVSVLLGDGDGTFQPKYDYPTGGGPLSVAIGDLDGDGKPDLAVANYLPGTVSVLIGNGDGTFKPKTDYPAGTWPWSVVIEDLDGDGKPDLAVANRGSNTVSVLLGRGGGTFGPKTDYETGGLPRSVAIEDLNGDGKPDLAVANEGSSTVSVFGTATGQLTSTSLMATPNPSVSGQPIALDATVVPSGATGSFTFYDGSVSLGAATVTDGMATLAVSNLSTGIHSLTARYSGNVVYVPSISATVHQNVNAAGTSTVVSSSANPSLLRQAVCFAATVVATPPGNGTPTGTVQFRVDHKVFGPPVVVSGGSATSPNTDTLWVGSHEVQAIYSGDANFTGSTSPVLADSVVASGPVIVGVRDVPNDQGGRVFVTWHCPLDQPGVRIVTGYRIWRRVPGLAAATQPNSSDAPGIGASPPDSAFRRIRTVARDGSVEETFWEAIATLPSAQLVSYGYTAATTQDSMGGSNPYTAFFVQALSADPFGFLSSAPDSGYSVDNLSPAQPAPFAALYGSSGVALHWGKNAESDLREYRLYRGTSPSFTPGPSNLLVAQPDTGFFDASGSLLFAYKISAVDIHGNESRFALVTPQGATGALASLLSVEVEGSAVRLRWMAVANPGLSATVYRRTPESAWTALGQVSADGTGIMAWNDAQVVLGQRYGYRLGIWDGASEVFLGEAWIEVPTLTFALEGVRPNPSKGEALLVSFSLPSAQPARLELLDVTGRRIASNEVGSLGAGRHSLDLREGRLLAPGLYLVRLTQGRNTRVARVAALR